MSDIERWLTPASGFKMANLEQFRASKLRMAIDPKSVEKPFRKLRKLLTKIPHVAETENVRALRTNSRRIEAVVESFQLQEKKAGRNLLRTLKPIRKAAGSVRDMDVLIDLAASLDPRIDSDCRIRLTEHLADKRKKAASRLIKEVEDRREPLRALIKKCEKLAERNLGEDSLNFKVSDRQKGMRKSAVAMAVSFEIEQELRDWPTLTARNLHEFRLKVKDLRNVLQLGEGRDSKLVTETGRVKAQAGLWHDWDQLRSIAAKTLKHGGRCPLAAQIRARTKDELQKALAVANDLRSRYLRGAAHGKKRGVTDDLPPAALKATARLAS